MKRQTKTLSAAAFFAVLLAGAMPLSGQYSYYYSSNLSPINSGDWTQNGTGGYGGSSSENSLIATAAVPNGGSGFGATNEYEVNTALSLTVSGGYYQHYLRATSNAFFNGATQAATGTFTLVQLTPTVTIYGCTAQLTQWDVFNGAATQLSFATVPCGATMRSVIYGSTISRQINGEIYTSAIGNTGGGQPGFGLGSNPSGNSAIRPEDANRSQHDRGEHDCGRSILDAHRYSLDRARRSNRCRDYATHDLALALRRPDQLLRDGAGGKQLHG